MYPPKTFVTYLIFSGTSAVIPTGPFIVTFDENGTATIGNPTMTLQGSLMIDPTANTAAQVMTYLLPEPVGNRHRFVH
jgi:hypothetical protein